MNIQAKSSSVAKGPVKAMPPIVLTITRGSGDSGGVGSRVWEGAGLPNDSIVAEAGDRYLDTSTGTLYEWEPET